LATISAFLLEVFSLAGISDDLKKTTSFLPEMPSSRKVVAKN